MKKFKKVIPALCMLMVSAIMLGSSTYAWFSMNKEVKAEGMNVTAKANTTYLEISTTENSGYATSVTISNAAKSVYPCAYASSAISGTEITAGKFYTANSTDFDKSNENVTNYKEVELTENEYFYKNTLYLKLSKDSEAYNQGLKITYNAGSSHAAVKAVVKIDNQTYHFTSNIITINSFALQADTAKTVEIYVYIDGTNDNVNSNWFNTENNLEGTVGVTFELVTNSGT